MGFIWSDTQMPFMFLVSIPDGLNSCKWTPTSATPVRKHIIMQHFGKHYTSSCIQCLFSQGLENLARSSHDFFPLHCHLPPTLIINGKHSYVIQHHLVLDQHPDCWELYITSSFSSYETINKHIPIHNFASSDIPVISAHTIHEQYKLSLHPIWSPLPSLMMTQSTILTWTLEKTHWLWDMAQGSSE